jgi:hypothetical protein
MHRNDHNAIATNPDTSSNREMTKLGNPGELGEILALDFMRPIIAAFEQKANF